MLALLLAAAAAAGICGLEIRGAPGEAGLARLELQSDQQFSLRYTHSVTLRAVESRYEIRGGHIVQTAEVFDQHGPGMATEPLAGERFDTERDERGVRYVLTMQRPIERLVVRVHRLPAQTLLVGDQSYELLRFGERAVELKPTCDPRKARQ